jgi:hypothetical protein
MPNRKTNSRKVSRQILSPADNKASAFRWRREWVDLGLENFLNTKEGLRRPGYENGWSHVAP